MSCGLVLDFKKGRNMFYATDLQSKQGLVIWTCKLCWGRTGGWSNYFRNCSYKSFI